MNNYNFNLSPALEALTAAINKLNSYSSSYFNNIAAAMNQVAKLQASLATNVVINNLKNTFSHIAQQISDAKNNPDSIFSWLKYERELEDMHWAWPYKISSNDILEILNQTYDEKDFDEIIAFHFTEELIEEIYNLLIKNVAKHHRVILRQAHTAFLRHDYAIANNALLSILDNSLSVYLDDAGESQRKGMFKPILEYYDNDNISDIATFIFELGMLSNNIDFIFTSINFARKEKITTNKIVRRHTALHGVKYSNKKIDTLMLFNTLINLVQLRPVLDKFKKASNITEIKSSSVLTTKPSKQ